MRIKCPNTDIFLELPGDRTDMKFTCPACHKVHRVTITISTPGEEAPRPANTRTMPRNQPTIPKKYATGAYPPVVDIPIDANFALLDEPSTRRKGVDLGNAAEPPPPFSDLSTRKTEIIDRNVAEKRGVNPVPPEQNITASSEETTRDEPAAETPEPAAPSWEEAAGITPDESAPVNPPPAPEPAPTAPEAEQLAASSDTKSRDRDPENAWNSDADPLHQKEEPVPERSSNTSSRFRDPEAYWNEDAPAAPRRSKGSKAVVYTLLLILLAAAGYLGYGEYRSRSLLKQADSLLSWADSAVQRGDIDAAASSAREAQELLDQQSTIITPAAVYNLASEKSGLFPPLAPTAETEQTRVRQHLLRESELAEFRQQLDPAGPAEMNALLNGSRDGQDQPLALAKERSVHQAALAFLNRQAEMLSPERALTLAMQAEDELAPSFSQSARGPFMADLSAFSADQIRRLSDDVERQLVVIGQDANDGQGEALERYRTLKARLQGQTHPGLSRPLPEQGEDQYRDALWQLFRLDELVTEAEKAARSVLARAEDETEDTTIETLQSKAAADTTPNPAMAETAVRIMDEAVARADDLMRLRAEIFSRVQSEIRRGRAYPGTRLAWSMLRTGFDDPEVQIDPAAFRFDTVKARMEFTYRGLPAVMEMNEQDYEKNVRITIDGYTFNTGWVMLFHKPLTWAAKLATAMRNAGVSPSKQPSWELLEGPGAPLALSIPAESLASVQSDQALAQAVSAQAAPRQVFFENALLPVTELGVNQDAQDLIETFREAAIRLHDGIMNDSSINQQLRQALKPILMGTYQKPDPQDYFDSAFCRRLIEANYLETYIIPMPPERQRELDAYRDALGKMEAGYDDFSVTLPNGRRLFAVARLEADLAGDGVASDQDPDTGELLPRYTWRVEQADKTIFFSPLPSRFVYAFMLAEHYPGTTPVRPAGVPQLTEVWHATGGRIASYAKGASRADGDEAAWNEAMREDSSGRFDPTSGTPGWNFPLHVIERDDQGDPITLATLTGTVKSPDFSNISNEAERRRAEDAWLDLIAKTLSKPGELGLIFHQFFRYCSDSPMPELPNLIGSHYGLSDTHQTVYQSLERRWVGRLIGDCEDLAELFQVVTRKQGKLSHVMQLPGHAACGYVEPTQDGQYRFVVLQTGPVMQFVAPTLNEAVELAYRAFDREGGISHMTMDAVPLLLRFANEETRTPFVLSARIYGDAEYADKMIEVQSYWHEHVYSAAVAVMEQMVAEDPEIGSIKELGSLYERVGFYDKSLEMRRREYELVRDNPQAAISCLLEIAQLHLQAKDDEQALQTLGEMESLMLDWIRKDDAVEFFKAMTFRSFWAMYMSRIGSPARAWNLVRYDATMTKRQLGRVAEPVLRTLSLMYERLAMKRDKGERLAPVEERAMADIKRELEEAFGRGYFKSDDSYNMIIGRYFLLGRYAVSDVGREAGLERLRRDGPYPEAVKDHTRRSAGVMDDDWRWFRIAPRLYLSLGAEMLDRDEYPELFDPERAKPLLEDVARAVEKGTGLGSDVAGGEDVIKAEMTLAFLNRDLDAFRRCLTTVKEKDYSSLYDEIAMTFFLQCGFIPLN